MPDTRAVALGIRVGDEGWEAKLLANKEGFLNAFVNRPAFQAVYAGMENSLLVDTSRGKRPHNFGVRDQIWSALTSQRFGRLRPVAAVSDLKSGASNSRVAALRRTTATGRRRPKR